MHGLTPDWYTSHRNLIDQVAAIDALDQPAAIARLRKHAGANDVRRAVELVTARRRAAGKLAHADDLLLDNIGVEQATSYEVAQHKAMRFGACGMDEVIDLCCGMGGDAMALAAKGQVTLADHDADRAAMARFNVRQITGRDCPTIVADVRTLGLRDRVFHLDPARRSEGRRHHRYEDYQPGPTFVDALIAANPTGAIKLGPGVDLDALPPGEVEFISEDGALVQAVLWSGKLAHHVRSATTLPVGVTISGSPGVPPFAPLGRYLHTVDAAVERAKLLHVLCDQLDAAAVHPALGIITADRPLAGPWVRAFEVIHTMPWRVDRVQRGLAAHDANRAQRDLRGDGDTTYTLFVLRYDQSLVTHITRRVGQS